MPRGRPSLTGENCNSPNFSLRVTPAMREAISIIAMRQGKKPSEVARAALEAYIFLNGGRDNGA